MNNNEHTFKIWTAFCLQSHGLRLSSKSHILSKTIVNCSYSLVCSYNQEAQASSTVDFHSSCNTFFYTVLQCRLLMSKIHALHSISEKKTSPLGFFGKTLTAPRMTWPGRTYSLLLNKQMKNNLSFCKKQEIVQKK